MTYTRRPGMELTINLKTAGAWTLAALSQVWEFAEPAFGIWSPRYQIRFDQAWRREALIVCCGPPALWPTSKP
jgi:hypothetical protein